jgi:uncharacterized membrane protein YgdD (TMEM256/DUF423 family)
LPFAPLAALLLAAAVGTGAFGAHALKDKLDAYSMGVWEKAVFYHFIHAIGMLIAALVVKRSDTVCWLLLAGILLFSGSLYALAITGVRTFGAVTPFGGVAFIAAWLILASRLLKEAP